MLNNKKQKQNPISIITKKLWGKLSRNDKDGWLPLYVHMLDTGEVAKLLWEKWIPRHTKQIIVESIDFEQNNAEDKMDYARRIVIFLATVHDLGKATPDFQAKANKIFPDIVNNLRDSGLSFPMQAANKSIPHATVSEGLLEKYGLDRSYAVTVGSHHGKPPENTINLDSIQGSFAKDAGVNDTNWSEIHIQLIKMALEEAELSDYPKGQLLLPAQMLVTSIIVCSDWIASGNGFPLLSLGVNKKAGDSLLRAQKAWRQLNLPVYHNAEAVEYYQNLYQKRFGITQPRPMQDSALQVAKNMEKPGLLVLEAPMGEGKTEAALAAAEVFMDKFGLSGIYFALPTQATSDGIFKRIKNWIEKLPRNGQNTIFLAHGKAGFNEDYAGIKLDSDIDRYGEDDENESKISEQVTINSWTQGKKKGLLSDFVVGTIDQILMCGLKQKHLVLRHLGVVNKVVIIDECHAYDAYMSSYLELVLNWLGVYHVPVILLSATLPSKKRQELLAAYQKYNVKKERKTGKRNWFGNKKGAKIINEVVTQKINTNYPLLSYTCGSDVQEAEPLKSGRVQKVQVQKLKDELLADTLQDLLSEGGCIGIIRNTVRQAQETAKALEEIFGAENVQLLHSRFISCDRVKREQKLRELLGPPYNGDESNRPDKLIVVGTQVMEQSLDVDFDALFTDICPMDLLLQRMGRLHRHKRQKHRPAKLQQAACYVLGIEDEYNFNRGTEAVYDKYLLLKTNDNLPEEIVLPDDIPILVEKVYGDTATAEISGADILKKEVFLEAKQKYIDKIDSKHNKAKTYQINLPVSKVENSVKTMIGMLNATISDTWGQRGEATVRDAEGSLNVIVVRKRSDGRIYTLPWLVKYADMEIGEYISDDMAKTIAGCTVSLPNEFSKKWNIDDAIEELERYMLAHEVLYKLCCESYWLTGELYLVLNENFDAHLQNKILHYDEKYGLYVKREG